MPNDIRFNCKMFQCCILSSVFIINEEHNDNERTKHFFMNIHLSFYSRKGPTVCCKLRDRWRDIYSERGLLLVPYLLPGAMSANACTPLQAVSSERSETPLIGCVSPRSTPDCLPLSKSDDVVITWSPSGYTPVRPDCPDTVPSPCLLITTWQLVKAHGVTRNEPKIHVIWYRTPTKIIKSWHLWFGRKLTFRSKLFRVHLFIGDTAYLCTSV